MHSISFQITARAELLADGHSIGQFATEAEAASMAIRFAQDNDALYAIHYARR